MAKFEFLYSELNYKTAVIEREDGDLGKAMEDFYRKYNNGTLESQIDEDKFPRIDSIYYEDGDEKFWEHGDEIPKNGMSYDDFHDLMEVNIDGTRCYMDITDVLEKFESEDPVIKNKI